MLTYPGTASLVNVPASDALRFRRLCRTGPGRPPGPAEPGKLRADTFSSNSPEKSHNNYPLQTP